MDRGKMLANAAHVLVQIAGGPAMTLSEVEILMKELGRHISDETQIFFGTAVDNRMGNRLSVTLISSLSPDGVAAEPPKKTFVPQPVEPPSPISPPIWEQREEPPPPLQMPNEPSEAPTLVTEFAEFAELTPEPEAEVEIEQTPPIEEIAPPPAASVAKKKLILPKEPKLQVEKKHAKQEVLQFEPVTRGRFEKSEPTIVEGQDLDVPTFLRKNVRVK
jgi:cell division protein FtsZ